MSKKRSKIYRPYRIAMYALFLTFAVILSGLSLNATVRGVFSDSAPRAKESLWQQTVHFGKIAKPVK